jgi:DNA-binding NarL/FixJ family response regulator
MSAVNAMSLRVMIVDDHKGFRSALRMILSTDPDIEVVAEAEDGVDALARAGEVSPDIVCMDVSMPRMNGIEATRELLLARPGVKVIGLSAYAEAQFVREMANAGAVGYVVKGDAGQNLLPAIHAVANQLTYFKAEE